jgi:putative FmdB family regulatory protein
MPLYEYRCENCSETLEAIQKFSDAPYTICPHCGGELRKLISSPAIHFKGAGFYINDYSRKSSGSETSTATSTKSEAPSGSGTSPAGGTAAD